MVGRAISIRHSFLALSQLPTVIYGTNINDDNTPNKNPPMFA